MSLSDLHPIWANYPFATERPPQLHPMTVSWQQTQRRSAWAERNSKPHRSPESNAWTAKFDFVFPEVGALHCEPKCLHWWVIMQYAELIQIQVRLITCDARSAYVAHDTLPVLPLICILGNFCSKIYPGRKFPQATLYSGCGRAQMQNIATLLTSLKSYSRIYG